MHERVDGKSVSIFCVIHVIPIFSIRQTKYNHPDSVLKYVPFNKFSVEDREQYITDLCKECEMQTLDMDENFTAIQKNDKQVVTTRRAILLESNRVNFFIIFSICSSLLT